LVEGARSGHNDDAKLFEQEPRLEQVQEIGRALERGLGPCRGLPEVKDVRVRGAIGVVELHHIPDLEGLRTRFMQEGTFIRPFGSIVYLTPAFTISEEDLAELTSTIVKVVGIGLH
jgi:adenosylmethionine---8-amino-7-oxononanoate aminotransferase